ncbi:MAG: VWA domain-containing protein, partial [Thermodesulfobacteriota bacterium]
AAAHGLTQVFRTDYGAALGQFQSEHLSGVNSRTTVFILGDARNNYFDPHPEALEALAGRAKRLIWLNPEPRANWRLGDSVMRIYQPYCTRVAECGNLKQLSTIIEENLLP